MEMFWIVLLLWPGYLKVGREEKGLMVTFLPLWWVLIQKVRNREKKSTESVGE
jgi:hypothetical protein